MIHLQDPAFGDISCSLLSTPNITLMYGSISLNQAVLLKTKAPLNCLNVAFILEGNLESNFYHYSEKIQLFNNSHNIIYFNDDAEGEHILPQGKIRTFHLNISAEYFMQNFASDDLITERLKNSICKTTPQIASQIPGFITPEMKSIMHSILHCPYKEGLKRMFLEIKALELITMQFFQFSDQHAQRNTLSQKEKQLALHVKSLLEGNFLHNWSLDELARSIGSNIQTLKKSFKSMFNMSIFEYYQQLRMEFAIHLIADLNMSISEVSDQLGYSHQNHFSIAFNKRFGYPPSDLKKKTIKAILPKSF